MNAEAADGARLYIARCVWCGGLHKRIKRKRIIRKHSCHSICINIQCQDNLSTSSDFIEAVADVGRDPARFLFGGQQRGYETR